MIEKLMLVRLNSLLNDENRLTKHQFGISCGEGTNDAILEIKEFAYDYLNNKDTLLAVLLHR